MVKLRPIDHDQFIRSNNLRLILDLLVNLQSNNQNLVEKIHNSLKFGRGV